jgi:hypothetical protein
MSFGDLAGRAKLWGETMRKLRAGFTQTQGAKVRPDPAGLQRPDRLP